MKYEYFKKVDIMISMFITELKTHKICYNPVSMIVKPGGVLLQDCVYNDESEHECPYKLIK